MTTPVDPADHSPTTAPRSGNGFPTWLVFVIAVVVAGGGLFAYSYFSASATRAKVGDCASLGGSNDDPDFQVVTCGTDGADHKVVEVLNSTTAGCGTGSDLAYTETSRFGQDIKLCLASLTGR